MTAPQTKPQAPPLLHGDGITDDTDAIEWYLLHKIPIPIERDGEIIRYRVRLRELAERLPLGIGFGFAYDR